MVWAVETIEKEWLGANISVLALPPAEIVAAFLRVEELLGRTWIEHARVSGDAVVTGIAPTLRVVAMGQRLVALDGVVGVEKLIENIRQGDAAAHAELTAIYLIRREPAIQVELEPPVGTRLADFRARSGDTDWVYVEVTYPDWSEATNGARRC